MKKVFALLALALLAPAVAGPEAAKPELYFIEPADGVVVSNPVRVVFGLRGMGIAPAGVAHPNTGHHHLIIDADTPPPGQPIPMDDRHRHFGGGQTEAQIVLLPGKHSLQLVLGDHLHAPHQPAVVSRKIAVTVK